MRYICTVSGRFPENYRIGIEAGRWGVEEKYRGRIEPVRKGDTLIFAHAGSFVSIHRIESGPFEDHTPLWPEKDGSLFPHRIEISDPVYVGEVPIREIAGEISFMRGRQWGGTLQGRNGVFNSRASAEDLELIQSRMSRAVHPLRYVERAQPKTSAVPETALIVSWSEEQLRAELDDAMAISGNRRHPELSEALATGVAPEADILSSIYRSPTGYCAVDFHRRGHSEHALLRLLQRMAWVRQRFDGKQAVSGLLLAESPDPELVTVVSAIPNVEVRKWRIGLTLQDMEPVAREAA
jgi:hypothetical protein